MTGTLNKPQFTVTEIKGNQKYSNITMFRPKNVYSVLKPMYYCTKIFGLAPFSINSKRLKKSKINVMWSMILMIFLNTYTSVGLNGRPDVEEPFITKVTDIVCTYLTQISMFCGILFGCIHRDKIINVIEDINKFDKKTNKFPHIHLINEYKRSKIYLTTALLVTATCITSVIIFTFRAVESPDLRVFTLEHFGEFLAYVAPETVNTFVEFQFCSLVLCLQQRFGWLNKKIIIVTRNLQKSLHEYDNILSTKIKRKRVRPITHIVSTGFIQDQALDVIEKVRQRHYDLCTISKSLNQAYSIQILLITIQTFVTVIVLLYYGGKHMLEENHLPTSYIMYCCGQISLAVAQIVTLATVCSNTSTEARKTGILIHNTILLQLKNKWKEDLLLEITSFSLQLLHQNVEFTACGIFVIDETLLFTIVGAITTYLVIVIQFKLGDVKTA